MSTQLEENGIHRVTICISLSFSCCPQGEERSRILPETNETWKQFVYKQKNKSCRFSLPIIILYFLFVLYNFQDEKQVTLFSNSQRCHFTSNVTISPSSCYVCIIQSPHLWGLNKYLFCFPLGTFET